MSGFRDPGGISVTVLYASETGNAEEVAYDLYEGLRGPNGSAGKVSIASVGAYEVTRLPEEDVVLFVVSTTGDGECPSSMLDFWKFLLQKSLPRDSLASVQVGVFGLGDSSYEKYNAAGRRLMMRCKQLGAREFVPLGLGDDQHEHGFFTGLRKWMKLLSAAMGKESDSSKEEEERKVTLELPEYEVQVSESSMDNEVYTSVYVSGPRPAIEYDPPHGSKLTGNTPLHAEVIRNERMTHVQWPQNVRNISLSFAAYGREAGVQEGQAADRSIFRTWPPYVAGDVATIHPHNPGNLVTSMLTMVHQIDEYSEISTEGLKKDTFVSVKRNPHTLRGGEWKRKSRLKDVSCTLYDLFTIYLDIAGPPRRKFFHLLSQWASLEEERAKLLELGSAEGFSLYHEYVVRERRNHVEVLAEFPSARPPLTRLLEMIPPLQPRHYSIASSSSLDPTQLDLCVAVEETVTPYRRKRSGLCSTYLANLRVGDEVVLWLRKGSFANPGLGTPLVMIGPGTGVAPMRALLQERQVALASSACEPCSDSQGSLLFFGCRREGRDYLYGAEWEALRKEEHGSGIDKQFVSDGSFSVTTAFSQDGPANKGKTYVMHKMRLHEEEIFAMLAQKKGHFYVAGSAKRMPVDVRKELVGLVSRQGQCSVEEAESFVKGLEKTGRYKVEAWSS